LGRGSFGEVYLVREEGTGRFVAQKRLPQLAGDSPEKLRKEFSLLASLNYPEIAAVYEFREDEQGFFFTEEYAEGQPLSTLEKVARFETLLAVTGGMARALQYLHRQGVVHGDLKPENVFFDETGQAVKVVDFSLAQRRREKDRVIAGTAAYMAPELFLGHPSDFRSDLYALGVVLYRLIAGRLPFDAGTATDLIHQHLFSVPLNPSSRNEEIPKKFGLLVLRLLNKNPADRFEEPNDLIRAINLEFQTAIPLGPEEAALDSATVARIRSGEIDLLDQKALQYYEERASRTEEESLLLAEICLKIGRWDRASEEISRLSGVRAEILKMRLFNRRGEFKEAKDCAEKILRLGTGTAEEKGAAANALGTALYYLGETREAERCFQEALVAYEEAGRSAKLSSVLNNLGNLKAQDRNWKGAEESYRKSLTLSQKVGDSVGEGLTLVSLGYLAHLGHDYEEALVSYRQGYEILKLAGERAEMGRAAATLASLYLSLGSLIKAEEMLREVREIAQARQNRFLIAYETLLEGDLGRRQGELQRAARLYREAASRFRAEGSRQELLIALGSEIETLLERKRYRQVEILLDEFRQEAVSEGSSGLQAKLLFFEARLLAGRGEFPQAVLKAEKAERLYEERGDTEAQTVVLWFLGCLYGEMHQQDLSEAARRKGRELFSRLEAAVPAEFRESFLKSGPWDEEERGGEFMEKISFPFTGQRDRGVPLSLLRKVFAINRRISVSRDQGAILETIVDAMIEFTGAERGFILLVEQGEPKIRIARNMDQEAVTDSEDNLSLTLVKRVLHTGEPVVILDAKTDDRFSSSASVQRWNLHAILCLPLVLRDAAIGVIYLDNRSHAGRFSQEMIEILQGFASQVAIAVENARLFREFQATTDELQRSHRELAQSKKQVEALNTQLLDRLREKEVELDRTKTLLPWGRTETDLKGNYPEIIGQSAALMRLLQLVDRLKDSDVPVFLFGESGSGKEILARAIHGHGRRASQPFISVNCSAIPENLLESEMFGYARGAFTGADQDKPGLLELADTGTLFLDEVADMPLSMQAKLLRVIEDGEVRRLGDKRTVKVSVRVLSASNRDLRERVSQKEFREDLFFRLNGIQIDIPPLRERREDLPLLIDFFLEKFAAKEGTRKKEISRRALDLLFGYAWPGNIRELENTLYAAVVLSRSDCLDAEDFLQKKELLSPKEPSPPVRMEAGQAPSLSELKKEFEKKLVEEALEESRWNIAAAARRLSMVRPQLCRLIARYHLVNPRRQSRTAGNPPP
jgi:transcriptional regulator with GAF, ATPase, and Fis domain/tetratricopeptide (TPR) repeat protein